MLCTCTSSVRTYIAKTLKHAIYAILYAPKVVVDILSTTTQVSPSCHGDNLGSMETLRFQSGRIHFEPDHFTCLKFDHLILVQLVLDKMSSTTFVIEAHPPT